jgi:mannose-6-phosphate isomerase-like protein (cupin superfamily)
MPAYRITQLDEIPALDCPCGQARRAFNDLAESPASVHLVKIRKDARTHYHKNQTEIYVILEGVGQIELDGMLFPVKPLTAIQIPLGCRHRAVGEMTVINLVIPPFDANDEWFDDPAK